ncbi:MAG: phytoene/squalene synthase family protein [Bacteroidetes bacterium]|nr:phytoene/squalene synthase family protein [Bacteroidota bacterium]
MKELFDKVSHQSSKMITNTYSTSFSLGIYCLDKKFHEPIYGIYGFVRLADEIVDSFHNYPKAELLQDFKKQTYTAIEQGISLNPVLNSFQKVVNNYHVDHELIETFLQSMEADLMQSEHNSESIKTYILGSAEVVGLMCLRVFTEGDSARYLQLKDSAMRLGAAFQKINFLRDLKADYKDLGRMYFPDINPNHFTKEDKLRIESEIEEDFNEALKGIKKLPKGSVFGVYTAYVYYRALFSKIRSLPSERILSERIRIPNNLKIGLLMQSYLKYRLNVL